MRKEAEQEPSWFAHWESQLPSPEELAPLSQSLITPDLALAFHISPSHAGPLHPPPPPPPPPAANGSDLAADSEFGGGGGGEEPARTVKRPRLVWTPQLHKRFVDAVAHLGIKNAVPKTIMQLMSVDGLTRENVASHLQKYRLYLKRMQGLSSSSVAAGPGGPISAAEAAEQRLFASAPVPHHFLQHRGGYTPSLPPGAVAEPFLPFVPIAAIQQQHYHHHHQIAAAAQFYSSRQFGQFGSPRGGHLDLGVGDGRRLAGLEEVEAGADEDGGERRVLTLFPTGEERN